jgi:ubiquinone/menaquinone biosynthesis C-methylase UbiE
VAPELDPAIAAHYGHDPERDRLQTWARLEGMRTRELLSRFLPAPPAVVLDVGGARGAYALPLAREGYEVHLLDPWRPHVEAAAVASAAQGDAPLASVAHADARDLPFLDATADAVLLLGPLYHLPAADERAQALAEARRVASCEAEACCSPPPSRALRPQSTAYARELSLIPGSRRSLKGT